MGGGSTQESHQTTTTELPQWVQDAGLANYNMAQGIAAAPNPYYQGPTVVGQNALQGAANANAAWNVDNSAEQGMGLLSTLQNAAGNGVTYNPYSATTYGTQGYTPATYGASTYAGQGYTGQGYNATTYDAAQAGPTSQIKAGLLSNTDLSPYMNPYVKDVVDNSMAKMEQQRQLATNANNASAAAAGAFGGSRAAVQQAVSDAQATQNAGLLSSQLYSQGFDNAQNAAVGDISRALQADTQNAANTLNLNEFNTGQTNTARSQNAAAINAADAFTANAANAANAFTADANNTANRFNAGQIQLADAANAGAMNAAQVFGLSASNAAAAANAAAENAARSQNAQLGLQADTTNLNSANTNYGLQLGAYNALGTQQNAATTLLAQAGAAQQANQQAALTGSIAEKNQAAAYPQQMVGLLESALGMTPYNTTTQSDGTVSKSQSPDGASIGMGLLKMFNPFSSFMSADV